VEALLPEYFSNNIRTAKLWHSWILTRWFVNMTRRIWLCNNSARSWEQRWSQETGSKFPDISSPISAESQFKPNQIYRRNPQTDNQ